MATEINSLLPHQFCLAEWHDFCMLFHKISDGGTLIVVIFPFGPGERDFTEAVNPEIP